MTKMSALGVSMLLAAVAVPARATPVLGQSVTEVPLREQGGRMVVPVRAADGTELRFLVTTGSPVTLLSASTAAKVGDQALTLGGAPVEMEGSRTLPDSTLTFDGVAMDGLVSNNTLNHFDVLFDVPAGRLLLKPIGRSMEWPGVKLSDPVRLRVYHGVVLALDVAIDGKPYPAMLELGSPSLLANQAVLDEAGITDGKADLRMGTTDFPDLAIHLSDHPSIARFSPSGAGFVIVGAGPAATCAIAISWVHREMRTCVR